MPIIPTKNPMALIGYYLGVASLIPILGCFLAPIAVIMGIVGALKANSNPQAGGMGHAITAIVLGIIGPILWAVIWTVIVNAPITNP